MPVRSIVAGLVLVATPLFAQHGGGTAPALPAAPPREAAQFDFLLGQWELEVKPTVNTLAAKIHGVPKMLGSWKAWRALDGWGLEDELRITDAAGNPQSFTHAVRLYDATTRRWRISTVDVYRSVLSTTTAEVKDGVMTVMSTGNNAEGKTFVARTRYSDITPTSFRFRQERSYDDGAKWALTLSIDAKRVAAVAPR
ncbi:MAG: hypothetical protein AABZ80_00585 [Gemmatimonadota bacterium]